mmetsp:Transcript_1858/g.6108  ORF Transcript_1858/g.6108 Transcript_1858/m.6108 type:complete len:298 (-) Transcript_1858:9-902(-)
MRACWRRLHHARQRRSVESGRIAQALPGLAASWPGRWLRRRREGESRVSVSVLLLRLDVGARPSRAARAHKGERLDLVAHNRRRLWWEEDALQQADELPCDGVADQHDVRLDVRVPRLDVLLHPVVHAPHHPLRQPRPGDATRVPLDGEGAPLPQHARHKGLRVRHRVLVEPVAGRDPQDRVPQPLWSLEHDPAAVREALRTQEHLAPRGLLLAGAAQRDELRHQLPGRAGARRRDSKEEEDARPSVTPSPGVRVTLSRLARLRLQRWRAGLVECQAGTSAGAHRLSRAAGRLLRSE